MRVQNRMISTEDGRSIHLVEAGQPDGTPVLVHHGTPGSGLLYDRWIKDAEARGIRLISYDRPGYGGSTPNPGRQVASVAGDVRAIARTLNLERLLVWGVSGGGPHALACAALLPDLVMAAASLAAPAPYGANGLDWFAGMGEDNITEFGAALKSREAVKQFIEAMIPALLNPDGGSLDEAAPSLLSPADAAVSAGELGGFLNNWMREGIQASQDGWIDDDIAFTTPWGFELSQIRIPLLLMQGEQDRMVPFDHGRWLATQVSAAETRFLAEDGHLTLIENRIPEVHAWLLSKC